MMLRAFRKDDLDRLHELVIDTIGACYPGAYPPRAVAFFKAYHSRDNILGDAERGATLVLEAEGLSATGTLVDGGIKRVFVRPSQQGRGHGRRMMSALEQVARERGLQDVALDASLVSIDFYRQLGYVGASWEAHDVGEGQSLRYLVMRKRL
jgi:GNAT superfamily N-acetyltransferase